MGDAIDNIPGVPKCGPKTAAKWIGQYGDLDGVIAHAEEVGGKIGENLRAALPQLPLSRQLATIKLDCELEVAPTDLALRPRDVDALRELYTRYAFTQALKELDKAEAGPGTRDQGPQASDLAAAAPGPRSPVPGPRHTGEYELVTTRAQLDAWLEKLRGAELIAFDSETTSLDAMDAELVGLSFAVEAAHACYIPVAHDYPGAPAQLPREEVLAALKPILEDVSRHKLGQNAKYDLNVLSSCGITVRGLAFDSMLESYVLNATAGRHDMDTLAKRHLDYDTVKYSDVTGKGAKQISFSQVDLDTACRYAAEDADVTLRLHQALWPQVQAQPHTKRLFEEIELPLVEVLARMEQRGVLVDAATLKRQGDELGKRMHELQQRAFAVVGHEFNVDSPKQLQALLFEELKLPALMKTPTGQPSTNEEALEAIADQHELPRVILDYRALAKLRSTYTDKLPLMINRRTGRVHTCYHQAAVATGRVSSTDPNLQNIPIKSEEGRRIRQAFIAPPGWKVVAADYSQIELRIMAHLSGDKTLIRAFQEGADVHRATAAEVFGVPPEQVDSNQRRAAKVVNFGLMYGMSAHGLSRALGIGRLEAGEYIARYFERFPGVRAFMDSTREQAQRDGYVETLFGRRLYLESLRSRNAAQRAGAERAAINAPMQGTAADIIKRAMIEIDAWLSERDDAHMLMQVHDELVFEVKAEALDEVVEGVKQRMQAGAQLSVPLLVEVGSGANWDEAH
jgi:DNA polymerase-1